MSSGGFFRAMSSVVQSGDVFCRLNWVVGWVGKQDIYSGCMQESCVRERELEFSRFCSYAISEVLGVSVEGEYLYLVQPRKISVYEYHGNRDRPQLSEELIHNRQILDYAISPLFICVRSAALIELRDRRHWENVVLTYPLPTPDSFAYLALDARFLYVGQRQADALLVEKIDIDTKSVPAVISLGRLPDGGGEFLRRARPIFLGQLGMLNDFYIWARNEQEVELGMLYTSQGTAKRKFEINQIAVAGRIHQLYHHRVDCVKYPAQSPEYVLLLVEKDSERQIYLHIYEIMPRDHSKRPEDPPSDFHGQFQNILNQFSFLKNLNEKSAPSSLVQQVFSEAIAGEGHSKAQTAHFEVKLEGILSYESSFHSGGRIWVVSEKRICEVQLMEEESIEVIVKSYRTEQRVIKAMTYQEKPTNKRCIAIYKDRLLFSENTTSFDIAFLRDANEEIAEEIEEYEINDEILEKEAEVKISEEAERLRNDFLKLTCGDGEDKACQKQKKEKVANPMAECFSQTEVDQPRQIRQFGTQTMAIAEEKGVPVGLQQMQELVAKYSSAFTVSCGKVKQNHFLKDKFDREIFNIVEGVVKDSVQPFLEGKFLALLEDKIKQISQHISTVFENQLEGLNELMRKNEAKENTLRGKRIFQFSSQVGYIRETVASLTDALKASEVHKLTFNALLLEQAKEMREDIAKISASIAAIQNRSQASEKEVGDQIGELFEMLKTLEEKQKENLEEDSSSSSEASEVQGEQREIEQTSEDQQLSEGSNEQLEREEVRRYSHHFAPRGGQQHKKNKRSFDALDSQGYGQPYPAPEFYHAPPVPQMSPYYYPFMPQAPSLPMHGYYRSSYPYPTHVVDEVSKVQPKKGRAAKKAKKASD